MTHLLQVLDLGRTDYATALELQQTLAGLRKQGRIRDTLLLVEHEPVITLGRNSKAANVVASPASLAARGIAVVETNRGGDVTYHGPGQLVGYPIFDLRALPAAVDAESGEAKRIGAIEYVRRLEEALIRALADFGIAGQRVAGRTGVWTIPAGIALESKIAAIGIHISRGVTSHGFALNVTTAPDDFQVIVPCGISDRAVTSMEREAPPHFAEQLTRAGSLEKVAEAVTRQMGNVFGLQVLWLERLEQLMTAAESSDEAVSDEARDREERVPDDDRLRVPEELRQLRELEDISLG